MDDKWRVLGFKNSLSPKLTTPGHRSGPRIPRVGGEPCAGDKGTASFRPQRL